MDEDPRRDDLAAAWRARWPRHCRACRGWGQRFEQGDGGASTDDATAFVPCTAMRDIQCHRCGGLGRPDPLRPCQYCGWEFDDGS